jgi:transposase
MRSNLRLVLRNAIETADVFPFGLPFTLGCIRDRDWPANHEVIEMLDKQTRGAILLLHRNGHSLRGISRLLSLSRDSVRKVVSLGSDEPPMIHRPRKLDAHRERIVQMLAEFDAVRPASELITQIRLPRRYGKHSTFLAPYSSAFTWTTDRMRSCSSRCMKAVFYRCVEMTRIT